MPETEVAIVGGGISGLSTAYELERRGVPYTLFERTTRLGGVIRTDQVNGFTIDGGPDSLLVQKPAAIELCRELGLGDRLVPTSLPRTAYVVRAGRLFPLPEASVLGIPTRLWPLVTTGLLSPAGKLQMALDVTRRARPPHDQGDESVAAFFGRRFGHQAVDYIAEPLLAGIHAGDVDRLSMSALFPRLVETERRYRSVIRGFRSLRTTRSPDGPFRSLAGGIEELTRTLVRTLSADVLHCGTGVVRLSRTNAFQLDLSNGETVTARQIVLSVPAYVTADLVDSIDPRLSSLCREIPYTSTATVALSYARSAVHHELHGTGFVVPRVEREISLMAGSWVSSKWPGRAPEGQVLLRGFVGGARNPEALEQTDAGLISTVHRDLATLLGIVGEPVIKRVYRWPRLNPQHEVGHLDRLAQIDECVAHVPGLHVTGAGVRGVGIPDCVANGRAAGAAAAEQRSA